MNEILKHPIRPDRIDQGETSDAPDLRKIWSIVRRRWRIILWSAALALSAVLVWLALETPIYTATARLLIEPRKTKPLSDAIISDIELDVNTIATEVSLVKSFPVARRAVERLNLMDHPAFSRTSAADRTGLVARITGLFAPVGKEPVPVSAPAVAGASSIPPAVFAIAQRVEAGMTVRRVATTYFIDVSFSHLDAAMSASIANAIAGAYLDEQIEARYQAAQRATGWLSDRVVALRVQLEASERALSEHRARYNLAKPEAGSLAEQQATEVNAQLVAARAQTVEKKAKYEQAQRILDGGAGIDSVAAVMDTPAIAALRGQQATITRQRAELLTRYGPEHPAIVKIRAEHADIEKQIAREVGRVVQTLRTDYEFAQKKEDSLEGSLSELTKSHDAQEQTIIRLRELERDVHSNRTLYDAVLARFKEAEQQTSLQNAESRLVAPAFTPGRPSYPQTGLFLLAAIAGGVILGLAVIATLEFLEKGFTGAVQIERMLGLPVIALVPQLEEKELTIEGRPAPPHKYAALKPQSAFGESIRSARLLTQSAGDGRRSKLILITSSIAGEGKTTMALSFAMSAAISSGQRVLLIDCDLRAQSASRQFNLFQERGLTDYLGGTIESSPALYPTTVANLTIMPAGSATENPPDLLGSEEMAIMLQSLRDGFDVIIMDAPPLLPVIDSVVLAGLTDRILLVVGWRKTPRNLVSRAVQLIEPAAHKISGVALNGARMEQLASYDPDNTYYHKSYQAYYAR
jgi:succinoglycan biosynthesis transport protein ExoP